MRLGLLGGTFNPVHRCHLEIAAQCRSRLNLHRILFIPSGDPPHKPPGSLAPAHDRMEMLRLAIGGQSAYAVSDIELRQPGKSYSIDTVRSLRKEFGPTTDLFFLIGLDAFVDLPNWREPEDLLTLCSFTVLSRPGRAFRDLAMFPLLPSLDATILADLDAGRRDRYDVPLTQGRSVIFLATPPCTVSASDIRARIRGGRPTGNLLPAPVESYIIRRGLYRGKTDRTGVED